MHIHKEELDSFENNSLNSQDMIAFLEHLDTCDFCLEQLIQEESVNSIQAPAYLKKQIMKKAASPEIQASKAAAAASFNTSIERISAGLMSANALALPNPPPKSPD